MSSWPQRLEPSPAGLSMDCAENLANFEKRYQTAWHCWDLYLRGLGFCEKAFVT